MFYNIIGFTVFYCNWSLSEHKRFLLETLKNLADPKLLKGSVHTYIGLAVTIISTFKS